MEKVFLRFPRAGRLPGSTDFVGSKGVRSSWGFARGHLVPGVEQAQSWLGLEIKARHSGKGAESKPEASGSQQKIPLKIMSKSRGLIFTAKTPGMSFI